jgi:tetratricopeptide (TPR) repeat protein
MHCVSTEIEKEKQRWKKSTKKPGDEIGEFTHTHKVENLIDKRDHEGALKACNKILDAHPDCGEALLIKAERLFRLEKLVDSLDCLKTLLEINPDLDRAHYRVAGAVFVLGEYDNAMKAIDKALKIHGDSVNYTMMKAQILCQSNDSSYTQWIEKARKIDSQKTEDLMEYFWIEKEYVPLFLEELSESVGEINDLMSRQEYKKAIDAIDKKIDLGMEQEEVFYSMKIECLICLEEYGEAEKFIRELIKLNRDYPMAYFYRAVIKFRDIYFKEALDELNKCIEIAEIVQDKMMMNMEGRWRKNGNNQFQM